MLFFGLLTSYKIVMPKFLFSSLCLIYFDQIYFVQICLGPGMSRDRKYFRPANFGIDYVLRLIRYRLIICAVNYFGANAGIIHLKLPYKLISNIWFRDVNIIKKKNFPRYYFMTNKKMEPTIKCRQK